MSGVMSHSTDPETPFLTSESGVLIKSQAPVIKRIKVLKHDIKALDKE